MGVGRIFSRGENSGFFQVVAKSIFPGEANNDEISFYQLRNEEKNVFILKCLSKNITIQNPGLPLDSPSPSDARAGVFFGVLVASVL